MIVHDESLYRRIGTMQSLQMSLLSCNRREKSIIFLAFRSRFRHKWWIYEQAWNRSNPLLKILYSKHLKKYIFILILFIFSLFVVFCVLPNFVSRWTHSEIKFNRISLRFRLLFIFDTFSCFFFSVLVRFYSMVSYSDSLSVAYTQFTIYEHKPSRQSNEHEKFTSQSTRVRVLNISWAHRESFTSDEELNSSVKNEIEGECWWK